MILGVRGVQVGSKNRLKINQKTKLTSEGILVSIFNGFWWVWGGKLGGKIEPRATKKRSKNASKKQRKIRCVLERTGGGARARHGRGTQPPSTPPVLLPIKKKENNPQTHKHQEPRPNTQTNMHQEPRTLLTPSRFAARWRIC